MIRTKDIRNNLKTRLQDVFNSGQMAVEDYPQDIRRIAFTHPRMTVYLRIGSKRGGNSELAGQQDLYISIEVTIFMRDTLTQDERDDARDDLIETITAYPFGYQTAEFEADETLFQKSDYVVFGQRYRLKTLNFPGAA